MSRTFKGTHRVRMLWVIGTCGELGWSRARYHRRCCRRHATPRSPPELFLCPLACGPVLLAAWAGSLAWSLGLALAHPLVHVALWWLLDEPWPWWVKTLNTLARLALGLAAALVMTALHMSKAHIYPSHSAQGTPTPFPEPYFPR